MFVYLYIIYLLPKNVNSIGARVLLYGLLYGLLYAQYLKWSLSRI